MPAGAFFLCFFLVLARSWMLRRRKNEKQRTIITGLKTLFLWVEKLFSSTRNKRRSEHSVGFPAIYSFFTSDFHSLSPTALIFRHFVFFIVKLFRKLFNTFLLSFFFCCYWGAGKELWKENRMLLRYIELGWFLCQLTLKLF